MRFVSPVLIIILAHMKICHLSDSHLGAGEGHVRRGLNGLTLRQQDLIDSFIEAVDAIIEIRPDVCVHSGDLFHAVRPSNRIMSIAAEQLHRLADREAIPTVIIAGNHDAPRQAHHGAALEVFDHIANLYISARSKLETFDIGSARFHALPHCLTTRVLSEQLFLCEPSGDVKYNVLILHGVAAGMPEFSMADLGEQEIPMDVLERFDYVALGHYHNYTRVGPKAFYAGSTERLSQSERDHLKGFVIVNLERFDVQFRPVRCREMISLPVIDAAGKRGDQLATMIEQSINKVDSSDKIVRLKIEGVSEETLKTIPVSVITELKQKSYSLDITFERTKSAEDTQGFGRSAIGRLDAGFIQFIETVDLSGFDRERLKREALGYLAEEP